MPNYTCQNKESNFGYGPYRLLYTNLK